MAMTRSHADPASSPAFVLARVTREVFVWAARARKMCGRPMCDAGHNVAPDDRSEPGCAALTRAGRSACATGLLIVRREGKTALHSRCSCRAWRPRSRLPAPATAHCWITPGGVTPRPRLLSRTVSRAAARGRRCAHSRRDVLHSSRWSKVSAPSSGETNRRRARRTHARRAPVADLARSLPRARPPERREGGASRKRMPSEQMLLSICSCRESLERSPRSASRRPAPATFASRAAR